MYKPYHLIGLELGISVLSAALRGEPTGPAHAACAAMSSPSPSATCKPARCSTARAATRSGASWCRPRAASPSGALPIGLAHQRAAQARRRRRRRRALGRRRCPRADLLMGEAIKTRRAMEAHRCGKETPEGVLETACV